MNAGPTTSCISDCYTVTGRGTGLGVALRPSSFEMRLLDDLRPKGREVCIVMTEVEGKAVPN